MSEKTSNQFSSDFCLLILRVSAGFLMIHHGFEKLQDPAGFTSFIVDQYFSFLPFDHILWTYLAAYTQIIGSVVIVLGIATRPAVIGLLSTMLFAMTFHLLDTGLQGAPFAIVDAHNYEFEASALYLFIFLVLAISGPGSLSLSSVYRERFPQVLKAWV
jgi:uncharacterized membrane protein YphA (DoxX/SURF4 family)